jgi:hypothetical protein
MSSDGDEYELACGSLDPDTVAWRYQRLTDAGFPFVAAAELAMRRDVDLHQALHLAAKGCDPELAVAILA